MAEKVNIIDVIIERSEIGKERYFVVTDEIPFFVYNRTKIEVDGEEYEAIYAVRDGFWSFLRKRNLPPRVNEWPCWARQFLMADGSVVTADGDWTNELPTDFAGIPLIEVAWASRGQLKDCFVFHKGIMSKPRLDAWLANNQPLYDFSKYQPTEKQS